jgi:nucleoside 2-deoxyribosyltransferase
VKNAITDVFAEFGVSAVTADDIEHDGGITEVVLQAIETSEFLFADLTFERPNVYYEVGHAHARNRRVILYRKKGTKLHFDLAHRNCPEYENLTQLKELLRKRLEAITNRAPKG